MPGGGWAPLELTEPQKAYLKQVLKTKTIKFSESEEERLVGQNAVSINIAKANCNIFYFIVFSPSNL